MVEIFRLRTGVKNMNLNKKIIVLLGALFIGIISGCSSDFWKEAYGTESATERKIEQSLQLENVVVTTLFETERGFGNDRFDIHQFKLESDQTTDALRVIDDQYWEQTNRFKSIVEEGQLGIDDDESFDGVTFLNNWRQLEEMHETVYRYVEHEDDGQNYRIYVYNPTENIGYYIDDVM